MNADTAMQLADDWLRTAEDSDVDATTLAPLLLDCANDAVRGYIPISILWVSIFAAFGAGGRPWPPGETPAPF